MCMCVCFFPLTMVVYMVHTIPSMIIEIHAGIDVTKYEKLCFKLNGTTVDRLCLGEINKIHMSVYGYYCILSKKYIKTYSRNYIQLSKEKHTNGFFESNYEDVLK